MKKQLFALSILILTTLPLTLTAQQQHDNFAEYLKHSREINHPSRGVYLIKPDSIDSFFYNKTYGSDKKISIPNIRKYLFPTEEMTDEEVKKYDFHQGIHFNFINFIVALTLKNQNDLSRKSGLNTYDLLLTTYTTRGEKIDQKNIATGNYSQFFGGHFDIGDDELQEVLSIYLKTIKLTGYAGPQPQPNYWGVRSCQYYNIDQQGKISYKLTDKKKARIRLMPQQAFVLDVIDYER